MESDLSFDPEVHDLTGAVYDLEVGNDIEELKSDHRVQRQMKHSVDSDDNSSESGFSEQDAREGGGGGEGGGEEGGGEVDGSSEQCNENSTNTKTAEQQQVHTHL